MGESNRLPSSKLFIVAGDALEQGADLAQGQLAQRLGVSQSQVAKVERRGYESYTLTTLHRYVRALGEDFALEVRIAHAPPRELAAEPATG